MASALRNARRKSRLRRNVTLMRRELRQTNARHINAHFTLLATLVNAGGTIVIAPDKVQLAMQDMRFLNWQTQRLDDGSMQISMLDSRRKPCSACGGAGVITHDIVVGGTEHDTEETPCERCKDTGGYEPDTPVEMASRPDRSITAQLMGRPTDDTPDADPGDTQ